MCVWGAEMVIVNYALAVLAVILFRWGAPVVWPAIFAGQVGLIVLNYANTPDKVALAGRNAHLIAATALAHVLLGLLYYRLISADKLTPAVALIGLIGGVFLALVLSAVSIVLKKGR